MHIHSIWTAINLSYITSACKRTVMLIKKRSISLLQSSWQTMLLLTASSKRINLRNNFWTYVWFSGCVVHTKLFIFPVKLFSLSYHLGNSLLLTNIQWWSSADIIVYVIFDFLLLFHFKVLWSELWQCRHDILELHLPWHL